MIGDAAGTFAPGEVEQSAVQGLEPLSRTSYDGLLRRACTRFGEDHTLFEFPDTGDRLTVAGLRVGADRVAAALLGAGLDRGDAVAVWSPASPAWPILMFGAARVGVRVCGINTRYRSEELRHVFAALRPRLTVVATGFLDIDSVALVTDATAAAGRRGSPVLTTSMGRIDGGLAAFLDSGAAVGPGSVATRTSTVPVDADALVQFTSGSTGAPKAVLLSQAGSVAAAHYGAAAVGLGPEDVLYSPLPFFHIGGTISTALAAVASGCCAVLPQRFDAAAALRTMAARGCTAFHGHGALWRILLDEHRARPVPLPQLRKGWASGDAAFLTAVQDELGVPGLVNLYGSSESGTISCTRPTDPPPIRLGTLGRPTPGTVVSVRDSDGNEVPDGEVGELWLRGTMSMLGYLDTDGAPVPPTDGWIHTGDLVSWDADGLLRLTGRADERLKPGGENVSVAEIEEFLRGDDRIEEAVVVGIPDHRLGDVPAAVVRLAAGAVTDEAAIIDRCRRHIAGFKVPRHVRVVDTLPTLDTGKIDRRRVRAELLEHVQSFPGCGPMSGDVRLELAAGVATVTLARVHRRNALDARFAAELRDALATARAQGARTAVLQSSIPVFSAGVDLSEPIRQDPGSPDLLVAAALLDDAPYVVTAVEGPALAGGLLFAALSPIVVAGAQAEFWLPERSIGLFPGRVLAYLEQVVPPRSAHWLGVTEQRIGADEARDLGLVSVVVPSGTAAARAHALATSLAAAPPGFVDAAREAWRARFRSSAFEARRGELDVVLATNLATRDR